MNALPRALAVLEVFSVERLECSPEDLMKALGYSRPKGLRDDDS